MSRQYQDPNNQSGQYRTPYLYPPQQQGPQPSTASTPQSYFPTPNLPVATHQHERRSSHGHFPATGSSSDSQRLHAALASSDTGGGSNIYSAQSRVQPGPHRGGGYTATAAPSYGSRLPSMGTVSASESRPSSASPTPKPNLTVATHHQHERRSSHGHFPATGSSSDSQRLHAVLASSDTGGGSNIYSAQSKVQPEPYRRGSCTATAAPSYESGQGYDSHLLSTRRESASESQPNSASPTQSYFPTPNLPVATHHQHERRSSHDYFPATGSSSDSQRLHAAQSRVQPGPHHGEGYTATAAPSYGGRLPSMRTVSASESQPSSASLSSPQSYFLKPNLPVATQHQHQHGRWSSHGHFPATGSSSDSQRLHAALASLDTGSSSNIYSAQSRVQSGPHRGGGYTATAALSQDSNSAVYDERHNSRTKVPPHQPASASSN